MLLMACLMIGIGLVNAQVKKVTGHVTSDEDGLPVVGASVLVKGTTVGTVTDIDGNFTLNNVPSSAGTLIISFIGLQTQEVDIKPVVNVVLKSDSEVLDEVMVVAYGTAKKSSFTGSATNIHADQITSGSRESIDKALSGKVTGVRIASATGDPGSMGEMNIRGVGSINGSTTPLYVIDGVIMKSDNDMSYYGKSQSVLSTLNPDDIESMTILKDAAAASLYGSRAANGVVIITTKSGKEGKTRVSYNGEVGWNKMAVNQFEMMNATDYKNYVREAVANYYMEHEGFTDKNAAYTAADTYNGDPTQNVGVGDFLYDTTGKYSTNWKDEIYRTAVTQNHQVSLNGGNQNTRFYAGFGYNKSEGIVLGSDFQRISGRINADQKITDWADFSVKQMIASTTQNGFRDQNDQAQGLGTSSPLGILFAMDPTAPVKNEDGTYNENAGYGQVSNPHLMLGGKDSDTAMEWIQSKMFRSMTNAELSLHFLDKIFFRSVFGYDYIDNKHFEYWDRDGVNGASVGGMGTRYTFENSTLTSSNTLTYTDTFKEKHNLSVLLGFELENQNLLSIVTVAQNYSNHLPELSNGQPSQASSSTYGSGMLSYFGNVNYNFDDKYYLSGSFRRDGSSRLSKDNRWANFWSISGAWRLSKEGFMEDMPLFTDFKLKLSYGTNGNLPTDYYGYKDLYMGSGYGNNPAIYWYQLPNETLTWEKSKNLNVGFEWNMFNRVTLSAEYYLKKTTDLLFNVPTSYVTGFSSKWDNLGELKNDGVEIEINSKNIIHKDFTWNTNFNLTYQRSIVEKLPDGEDIQYGDGQMYIHREGESMYSFYLPEWKGVNPETGYGEFWIDPNDHSKGTTTNYSEAQWGIVGKALPDVMGGMTNTFTYKDFDLSFLITYQFGGDMFDYPSYFSHHDGYRLGSMVPEADVAGNYWTQPGDVVDNPKPVYGGASTGRSDQFSSRHIKSTDNIRLRELTVGYNIPISNKYINRLRVYFRANNLAMIWAKTKHVDPDVAINGYRQADTPQLKSCVFGINIEL
ncbi:TonB-dependent receptor [Bacteroidales bacterium SW299]|nr:TonB-dependent receptor [Bacteroidales bacterium SW299]